MQSITPLTSSDFKDKSNIIIGKAEIDSDGAGNYQELPDIMDFSVNTYVENRVGRLNSYGFSISVLNIDDQFDPFNSGSSCYNWLKQGRRIKLYTGIKIGASSYYYQWLIGRIDSYKINKKAGNNTCKITGRDFMRMVAEFRLYSPNTYWGTSQTFNVVAGQVAYSMNAACKGVYSVYLDSTSPYDGSSKVEIYEGRDWTYDWHNNKFCFTSQRIPDFAGTSNLVVYYLTTQTIEDVVGHILYKAGIFANTTERDAWIADASYVTPTGETIDRIWFNTGTSALEAIRLLAEVVQYRLWFDFSGNPIFKPKTSVGSKVDTLDNSDMIVQGIEENESETYTHIIVTGEIRDRVEGDDEIAPAIPSNLALTTGFGEITQAGLSWIKATWDANTETDFGHYELRIKKNADSDYTEVSTVATSYMFLGLEPGVTYNIQIRACDIYENRSDWSSAENQLTATDSDTPAQITGQTATAILAGIKIEWTRSSGTNIAYYLVERQESNDNIDWSGGWTEKTKIRANMWLDLLLTYSKYYRYRITAYSVAGVAGVTSGVTNAVQPNQAGTNDIVANAITAALIASDQILANHIKAGEIVTSHLSAGNIVLTTIADDYSWSDLPDDGHKPDNDADVTLSAINGELSITGGGIVLSSGASKIRAGQTAYATGTGFWLGLVSGTPKFSIGSSTAYLKWSGSALTIKSASALSNINVSMGAITAGSFTVNSTGYIRSLTKSSYEDTDSGFWMGYHSPGVPTYKFVVGNATHYLNWNGSVLDIKGKLSIGGLGTNDEIYFKDSAVTLYDFKDGGGSGFKGIALKYSSVVFFEESYNGSYNYLKLRASSSAFTCITTSDSGAYTEIQSAKGGTTELLIYAKSSGDIKYRLWDTGQLHLPNLSSNPTSNLYIGQLCSVSGVLKYYDGSNWKTVTVT